MYFREGEIKDRGEFVLNITNGKPIREHIAVAEYKYGKLPITFFDKNNGFSDNTEVIHHIDENSLNNDPNNLRLMSYKEHLELHKKQNTYFESGRKILSEKRKGKTWEDFYGVEKCNEIKGLLREKRKQQVVWNKGFTGEGYKTHYKSGFKNQFSKGNHKVVKIESGETIDVYDISVPKYHNFVANNVFVHNCYHPDILHFLDSKSEDTKKYTRSNFSVDIDSKFYDTLKKTPDKVFKTRNVVDKKENELKDANGLIYTYKMLWEKIIHNAWKSAEPGIFNGDIAADRCSCKHITRNVYSNPCLTGDTLVYVADGRGNVPIKTLADEGKDIPVFSMNRDGEMCIKNMVNPRLTRKSANIYKVTFDSGMIIKATQNHEFITTDGNDVRVGDLLPGASIKSVLKHELTIGEGYYNKKETKISNKGTYYFVENNGKKKAEHRLIVENSIGSVGNLKNNCDYYLNEKTLDIVVNNEKKGLPVELLG